jgi:hypothetical protein
VAAQPYGTSKLKYAGAPLCINHMLATVTNGTFSKRYALLFKETAGRYFKCGEQA